MDYNRFPKLMLDKIEEGTDEEWDREEGGKMKSEDDRGGEKYVMKRWSGERGCGRKE